MIEGDEPLDSECVVEDDDSVISTIVDVKVVFKLNTLIRKSELAFIRSHTERKNMKFSWVQESLNTGSFLVNIVLGISR